VVVTPSPSHQLPVLGHIEATFSTQLQEQFHPREVPPMSDTCHEQATSASTPGACTRVFRQRCLSSGHTGAGRVEIGMSHGTVKMVVLPNSRGRPWRKEGQQRSIYLSINSTQFFAFSTSRERCGAVRCRVQLAHRTNNQRTGERPTTRTGTLRFVSIFFFWLFFNLHQASFSWFSSRLG